MTEQSTPSIPTASAPHGNWWCCGTKYDSYKDTCVTCHVTKIKQSVPPRVSSPIVLNASITSLAAAAALASNNQSNNTSTIPDSNEGLDASVQSKPAIAPTSFKKHQ